jgi:hypothetical protein
MYELKRLINIQERENMLKVLGLDKSMIPKKAPVQR